MLIVSGISAVIISLGSFIVLVIAGSLGSTCNEIKILVNSDTPGA